MGQSREAKREADQRRKAEHAKLTTDQKLTKVLERNKLVGGKSEREVKRLYRLLKTETELAAEQAQVAAKLEADRLARRANPKKQGVK